MSGDLFGFTITAFTSIFIIVDPLGNIPIFLGLTSECDERRRGHVSRAAALTCFGVLSAFTLAGPAVMGLFSISLPAMRIAGGIILFVIGMQMLHVQRTRTQITPEEQQEWASLGEVGLVPLGIPLLAGPGAISTVIVLSQTGPGLAAIPIVIACIAVTAGLAHLTMMQATYLKKLLGRIGINIALRLMGLILSVIGVQFVLDGLTGVFPGVFRRAVG